MSEGALTLRADGRSGPDLARGLDDQLQLAALVFDGEQVSARGGREPALRADGEVLQRYVLGCLVDPPAQVVLRLQGGYLRGDQTEHDGRTGGHETQRLEPARPLGVVLQQRSEEHTSELQSR